MPATNGCVAASKPPKRVFTAAEMSRNIAMGKVRKKLLRDTYARSDCDGP